MWVVFLCVRCVHLCRSMEAQSGCQVSCSIIICLFLWARVSYRTGSSHVVLGCWLAATKPQLSSSLFLFGAGVWGMHRTMVDFHVGVGIWSRNSSMSHEPWKGQLLWMSDYLTLLDIVITGLCETSIVGAFPWCR